jgi:hypothetical protein
LRHLPSPFQGFVLQFENDLPGFPLALQSGLYSLAPPALIGGGVDSAHVEKSKQ